MGFLKVILAYLGNSFGQSIKTANIHSWENLYLVGGLNPSEKYERQLGWLFPIYGKIKFMFQTTNQLYSANPQLLEVGLPCTLLCVSPSNKHEQTSSSTTIFTQEWNIFAQLMAVEFTKGLEKSDGASSFESVTKSPMTLIYLRTPPNKNRKINLLDSLCVVDFRMWKIPSGKLT